MGPKNLFLQKKNIYFRSLSKKIAQREEDNANMGYLGDLFEDVNTTSNKAIIVCRDFEYEDGAVFKFY